MTSGFDYEKAFSRNLGWVTAAEQQRLRSKRVAIGGLGGVGGAHLMTLSRLGVGAFNLSDPDTFELRNFNRQLGATLSTIGRSKLEVMTAEAKAVQPDLDVRGIEGGIRSDNVDLFLADADLYIDGLDLFTVEIRRLVFARCRHLGIPAITTAPVGMGAAQLVFLPHGMSFEDYFCLADLPIHEQLVQFLVGLSPASLQRGYTVGPDVLDIGAEQAASTAMGIMLCAGMAGTAALKILLDRGRVLAAPWGTQFDAYLNRFRTTWRPWGNRNILQRITTHFARRQLILPETR